MIQGTMPGNHDPYENPCSKLEKFKDKCSKDGENCWPSFLDPQLNELKRDGKITPDEFEDELKVLNQSKLKKLMYDVQQHPIMWT